MKVRNISPFVFFDSNGVYSNCKSDNIGIRGHASSRDVFRSYIISIWYANEGHEWQQEYFGAKNGVVCQDSGHLYDLLLGRFSALTTMSSFRTSHRVTTDTAIALTTLLNIPTSPASCSAMEIYCGYEGDEIGEYIVDKIYGK